MAFLTAPISSGQIAFVVAFLWSTAAWVYAELLHRSGVSKPTEHAHADRDAEAATSGKQHQASEHTPLVANGGTGDGHTSQIGKSPDGFMAMLTSVPSTGVVSCLLFRPTALLQHRLVLRAVVEFGGLMLWYFVSDRTTMFAEGSKSYSRDFFVFLFVILLAVAAGSSLQTFKSPVLLNRPQTEEWKGWMQILFLLYHYFEAKEVYNAIRIFIAAYVWMTGFGNFSYYYKTADFSIGRFAQMLWRLNFLVFFVCVVLRNSYMLYYICPMHTIFTVFVYVSLAIAPRLNQNNIFMWTKIALCFVFIFVTWDIKAVFYAIWSPFKWLLAYSDPRKPTDDAMHEWFFRSSLDRYIWIYGMICAFIHPRASAILKFIDELPAVRRLTVRSIIVSITAVLSYFYYVHIYCLPKLEYNNVHPYTSWIPITLFIILRNMTPSLRLYHLRMFGWCGCITLETYISQFSIWMKTVLPDGQPKSLLVLIPNYPLLNFALVSALYVIVSHRLFELTNTLKNAFVPHSNNGLLLRNTLMMSVGCAALWGIVAVLYSAALGGPVL